MSKVLLKEFAEIPGVHHSTNADDITIWIADGSGTYIKQSLQDALATAKRYLEVRAFDARQKVAAPSI